MGQRAESTRGAAGGGKIVRPVHCFLKNKVLVSMSAFEEKKFQFLTFRPGGGWYKRPEEKDSNRRDLASKPFRILSPSRAPLSQPSGK